MTTKTTWEYIVDGVHWPSEDRFEIAQMRARLFRENGHKVEIRKVTTTRERVEAGSGGA